MPAPALKVEEYIELLSDSNDPLVARRAIRDVTSVLPKVADLQSRASLLTALGIAYCNLRNEEKSLASHRNAINTLPKYHVSHTNYGVSLRRFGRQDEALEEFLRAVEMPGGAEDPVALGNLAIGLWDGGLFKDALDVLDGAYAAMDPADLRMSLLLGRCLAQIGQEQLVLRILARITAARVGCELDLESPIRTIRHAPPDLIQSFLATPDLGRAFVVAAEVQPELAHLGLVPPGTLPRTSDSSAESEAYDQTKWLRVRATESELEPSNGA